MSQHAPDTYDVPESAKNRQLAVVATLVFGVLLAVLAAAVYFSTYATPAYNAQSAEAQVRTAKRIQKVGSVDLVVSASTDGAPKTGEQAYQAACMACHGAGVGGAPKFGDSGDWGPRVAQGADTLFKHALEGFQGAKGVMPAKGGSSMTDDEVKRAVVWMANHGGANFAEPKAAEGAAAGASGASAAAAPASAASN